MIDVKNISFRYKHKDVFRDFDLQLQEGRIYGLLGKNGAGKSTLLYLINGLLKPSSGEILFKGLDISKRLPQALQEIFIVAEEFELPNVSLKKYLKYNTPFYPNFSHEQLEENLKHFELDRVGDINLGALSMGQKKKVFMSFALAANTPLLIMDEPTNGLDIPGKSQFKKFIASNMSDERSILISTHQVQDIEKLIEYVLILDDSRLLLNASSDEICRKLYFANGVSQVDLENAFYSSPSLQGYNALFPNTGEQESTLNLETLFNGILANTQKITELFADKSNAN